MIKLFSSSSSRMMKLTLVSLILLLPLAMSEIRRCPDRSVLTSCICAEHYNWGPEVTCANFNSTDTLQKFFDNTLSYSFSMLNLDNCVIPYLKNTWFSSKGIYKLQITNVTAYDLFNNEGDTPAPSLTNVILTRTTVLRRVRWQQFKPFTHMKILTMVKTEVKSLGKEFKDGVTSRLESLTIDDARLGGLKDGDFDGKTVLSSIWLPKNKIKVLKKSFFKDQRSVLSTMGFSDNPIESIPTDLFEGMTALRYVYIQRAQIKTLSKLSDFKGFLNIEENPLACECSMSWIIASKNFHVDGTCDSPSFLKSKSLSSLTVQDFGACRNSLLYEH